MLALKRHLSLTSPLELRSYHVKNAAEKGGGQKKLRLPGTKAGLFAAIIAV